MEEWKSYKLSDVTDSIGDGIHGTPKYDEDGSYFFINGNNLENGKIIIRSSTKRVSEEEALKHRKRISERTILVSINGTLGNTARYNYERCILGKSACYLNVKEDVDIDFIYYVVTNKQFKDTISRLATGTTIKNVSLETMRNYEFFMPSLENQKKISSILKSIDDKIAINCQINDNLEQQAQNIFNHYFIDNPIELGSYSEGVLTDIAVYLNGLAMQKFRPEGSDFGLPVLKIKELGQRSCDNNSDRCSSLIKEEYIVNDGDVIFSWSGTLLVDLWCGGKCGLNQHLFKVTSDTYPKWFYYFWTKHHLDNFIRVAKDKAVTMGHIKRTELEKANIIVPTQDKLSEINRIMSPIITEIINHRVEMRKLAQLRDSLLPQLMSGELKINEIDS